MFRSILILSCLGLTAACATAPSNEMASAQSEASVEQATPAEGQEGDAATTQVAAKVEEEIDYDRVICKRTIVTGSRFSKKICKTWRQWKALEDASQEGLDRSQRLGTVGTPDALGQ